MGSPVSTVIFSPIDRCTLGCIRSNDLTNKRVEILFTKHLSLLNDVFLKMPSLEMIIFTACNENLTAKSTDKICLAFCNFKIAEHFEKDAQKRLFMEKMGMSEGSPLSSMFLELAEIGVECSSRALQQTTQELDCAKKSTRIDVNFVSTIQGGSRIGCSATHS